MAEGVETREQLIFLRKHGCNHVQGFIFSEALSPTEFLAMLEKFTSSAATGQAQDKATA